MKGLLINPEENKSEKKRKVREDEGDERGKSQLYTCWHFLLGWCYKTISES
jgi:hypothetical protein